MKIIKDYSKVYEELELDTAYLKVTNRKAKVKRCLKRLKQLLSTNPSARSKLKQYYKIFLKDKVKTRSRDLLILPFMIDKVINVYNGKFYKSIKVSNECMGRYVSEFVDTRTKGTHSKKGLKPIKRT